MKSIFFAIFDSHINYANLICGQNLHSAFRVVTLQKKAIRIINNQPKNSHSSLLFKKSSILKSEDKILINNIMFISKSIKNLLPPIFNNWFIFCSDIHNYDIVSSSADKLFKPSCRTDSYGKNSVIGAINCWNKMQNVLYDHWSVSIVSSIAIIILFWNSSNKKSIWKPFKRRIDWSTHHCRRYYIKTLWFIKSIWWFFEEIWSCFLWLSHYKKLQQITKRESCSVGKECSY